MTYLSLDAAREIHAMTMSRIKKARKELQDALRERATFAKVVTVGDGGLVEKWRCSGAIYYDLRGNHYLDVWRYADKASVKSEALDGTTKTLWECRPPTNRDEERRVRDIVTLIRERAPEGIKALLPEWEDYLE